MLILKRQKNKQTVYVMRNKRVTGNGFHKWSILANWANGRVAYPTMDIYDYIKVKEGSNAFKEFETKQGALFDQ
jgi:hypothetical protein